MATEPVPTPTTDDRLKALEAELKAERDKNTGTANLEKTVADLNQKLTAALTPPPPPPPKTDKPDFFVDPEGAVNAAMKPQLDALALNQLQTQAYLARGAAAGQSGEVGMAFRKWSAEIDALTKDDPLYSKTGIGYWVNAAKIVLANHIKEISDSAKSGKDFFMESGVSGVAPGSPSESKQRRQLTEREAKALSDFKRMGIEMSEEEYLQSQEEIMSGVQHNGR